MVQGGAVHVYLDAGGDVHVFRQGPVAFPLHVFDGIIDRRELQFVMLAKLLDIQFEHAALALVIGNLEEDVNLLVQLFHGF